MLGIFEMWIELPAQFAVLLLFVTSAFPQLQPGLISGTVLAADGNPIEDAHVSADVMKGSTILTVLDADTDHEGKFVFSRLTLGEYRLSGAKAEAGYLSTRPDIFNSKPALAVILTDETPNASATIRLGPKAAIITGWVLDSSTGRPISAQLSLSPWDGSGWSMTGINPKFKFREQIPPDTAIRFGACATGYKSWSYSDPSSPSRPVPVQLPAGGELDIVIKLEHSTDKMNLPCAAGTF
jgi:hypothetical protein